MVDANLPVVKEAKSAKSKAAKDSKGNKDGKANKGKGNKAVMVYTKSWCPYWGWPTLLTAKGVSFTEYDVETDPALMQRMMADSGWRTVPQIWLGEHHVGGFDQLAALERSGQLDAMLAAL